MLGKLFPLFMCWVTMEVDCLADKSAGVEDPFWGGRFPVVVIAHRGFSGSAPENTLAAFRKAIEAGSDMIELDVRLSRDREAMVIHDETLDGTTTGKGKVVDLTLKELKQLDAGSWFNAQFSGERIPILREVLALSKGHILVNIELKTGSLGDNSILDLAGRSLHDVEEAGMADQVLFSSFDPAPLEWIRKKNSRVRVAFLYNKRWDDPQQVIGGRPFSVLTCRKSVLTQANISRAKREGIRVCAYTLNTEEEIDPFLRWGVDGIITDHPDRLIDILRKSQR
jgi:glycerophosphoryl diester phosphodiesterase